MGILGFSRTRKMMTGMAIAVVATIAMSLLALTVTTTTTTMTSTTHNPATAPAAGGVEAPDGTHLNLVMPPAFAQVSPNDAAAMLEEGAPLKKITLVAYETEVTLPTGETTHRLTFNGTDPAPTIRVRQGDVVQMTMINHPNNTRIHSIDHHAATVSAVPNFGSVEIGGSKTYTFAAKQPGFFKYHCEGEDVLGMDEHVFSGMVGGVIVDPARGYRDYKITDYVHEDGELKQVRTTVDAKAKEFTLQFSELYINEFGEYDADAMYGHQPTYATINGMPFGYDPAVSKTPGAMPLHVAAGDHVRFFLMNAGDIPVNFHIVGEQLDAVTHGSYVQGRGLQTYLVGGSNDAIVDVVFDEPGVYAIVNHDYAALFKGQAAIVIVDDKDGKNALNYEGANPANAVPPLGPDSIEQETTPYYAGAPMLE